MDGAEVVAHVAELPWLRVALVVRIIDGLGRPYAYMAIWLASVCFPSISWTMNRTSTGGGQSLAIGRDVAAVDLEIFLFACSAGTGSTLAPLDPPVCPLIMSQCNSHRCGSARMA